MSSLRTLFRWMLLGWLAAVLCLVVTVSWSTRSGYFSNAVALMLPSQSQAPADLFADAWKPQSLPRPEAPEAPAEEAPQEVPAEWVPLAEGRERGQGSFGPIQVQELEDQRTAVVLPLRGQPGQVSYYRPHNVTAMSADLWGQWTAPPYVNRRIDSPRLLRVQIAGHNGYLRVSGVAADGIGRLEVRAEYSQAQQALRVLFWPAEGQ